MRSCILIGVIFAILLAGCTKDAPRDNPLDPVNGIGLEGMVLKLSSNQGIANAVLTLTPGNLVTITDNEGNFTFQDLDPGNYQLSCRAQGFISDSLSFELLQTDSIRFVLNALPTFLRTSVTTAHILRFAPPGEAYSLTLTAEIDDPDDFDNINQLSATIEDIGDIDSLLEVPGSGGRLFTREINVEDLALFSLDQLAGKSFRFLISDTTSLVSISNDNYISRFIERIPVTTSPSDTNVALPIVFRWNDPQQLFAFTYSIEILQFNEDETAFSTVDRIDEIPSHISSFAYNRAQPDGEYFWVLYIVDEFGNVSRSTPKPFILF